MAHRIDQSWILNRLESHKTAFNLRGELGGELLRVAVDGVYETFNREETPSGSKWAELTYKYKTWKEENYPGQQINVLTGDMAAGLEGVRETADDFARYVAGQTEFQREKIHFSHYPEDERRFPRKFVGLTDDSVDKSRDLLTTHLGEKL